MVACSSARRSRTRSAIARASLPLATEEKPCRFTSELVCRTQRVRAADGRLEQRIFANTVDEQCVALVGKILTFQNHFEVIADVVRRRSIHVSRRLVALQIAARRCRNAADVLVTIR